MGKINGNDIVALGFKPSAWFGEAIKYLNEHSLSRIAQIKYLNELKIKHEGDKLKLQDVPVAYSKNIEIRNEEERENFEDVTEAMDEIMRIPTIVGGTLMPDTCPTGKGQMPVGAVVVTDNTIHPAMHSSDVCCSLMLTDFGPDISPKEVLDVANDITHFGRGGRDSNDLMKTPESLIRSMKNNNFLNDIKTIEIAKTHMGTQGDGNHFLFVGVSEDSGNTIMVTHHGSRGVGARLYKMGVSVANKYAKKICQDTFKRNAWIPYDTDEGKEYWDALQIVREWTKCNHKSIHNAVKDKLKLQVVENMWNEHNFVFKDGSDFYHAKGATPLANKFLPDNKNGLRLIPLNMGEPILIVEGDTKANNLGFAPHGAGRNYSRTQHIKDKRKSNKTDEEIFKNETKDLDIRFFSGRIDISELPSAYKNAKDIQRQIKKFGLGEIRDRILPYGCIMAGKQKKYKRK